MAQTADVQLLGEFNSLALIEAIRVLGPISRAELAALKNESEPPPATDNGTGQAAPS